MYSFPNEVNEKKIFDFFCIFWCITYNRY
jgi:hypothetical protein